MSSFDLNSFANGAFGERFAIEIQKMYENIANPNTDPHKTRKLNIELKFVPVDRSTAIVSVTCKSSIAPYEPITTTMSAGIDENGELKCVEHLKGQMVGQTQITNMDDEKGDTSNQKVVNIR